jgi:hypothetical protein
MTGNKGRLDLLKVRCFMHRHIITTVVLAMTVLSSCPVPLARGTTEDELQEWMRVQLNKRLYDSCRAVKLKRQEVEVYQGFAEFINNQRSVLTVTVSDSGVTYKFGKSRPAGVEPNAVQFSPSEVVISRQRMEIARLEELCRRAGLNPRAAGADAERMQAADASRRHEAQEPAAEAPRKPLFTREMYEKIEKGMTCARVSDILGSPGETTSSSSFDGAENELRIWMNPDDSHLCIVFRNGAVLVKTQSGLNEPASPPGQDPGQADDLRHWQLAKPGDGRPVPVGLSLEQWLIDVQDALTKAAGEPAQVDVAEERDRIVVRVAYTDAQQITHHVELCLTPEVPGSDADSGTAAQRICVPASIRTDGKEQVGPEQAWEGMMALTNRPPNRK